MAALHFFHQSSVSHFLEAHFFFLCLFPTLSKGSSAVVNIESAHNSIDHPTSEAGRDENVANFTVGLVY